MKTLKIGRSDFDLMIRENHYFVDKSLLISEFYNNDSDIILIPRPKRFGKTLNMSMLENFFNIQKPENKQLFAELKISEDKEFCQKHQNKYPVISLSLKGIKDNTWERCYDKLALKVSSLYREHSYLLESDKLAKFEKEEFMSLIKTEASQSMVEFSLQKLSEYLYKHFNHKIIILVDEYDAPIINAFNHTNPPIKSDDKSNSTYYEKMISFMQTFLGEAFKDNIYLEKGLLTGVMRVGKESIFSEWNNVKVYDITSNYFSDKFGFTQQETEELLRYFNLIDQLPGVEKWYNGYKFGKTDKIYNPWSITNYLSNKDDGFKAYWVNSGDYTLIKNRVLEADIKQNIQTLIEGKSIERELMENFVFQDFDKDIELFWTLLVLNGYLTLEGEGKYGNYKLRIPNNEVKIVFTQIISAWLKEKLHITKHILIEMAENLINNNVIEFEKNLKQIVGDTLSYYDRTIKNEQIYHVYTLGLLSILSTDYIIKSNRESGEGRYDIMLIPHDKERYEIVIEFKNIEAQKDKETNEKFAERVNTTINKALQQIEKNKYYNELISNKIKVENIIKLPIIFAGKEPYVNELTVDN